MILDMEKVMQDYAMAYKDKTRITFIEKYLSIRENIQLIILILDIRHKPTDDDKLMYNYIRSTNIPFIIVANKADKIAVTKVDDAVEEIRKELQILAGLI